VSTCAKHLVLRCAATIALTCGALLVPATHVIAQISVDAPPGCGSEAELRAELTRLLGADAARAEPLLLQIRTPMREDAEYALELEVHGERRTLRDRDCRALFKAALVMAASVVEPSRVQAVTPDKERAPEHAPASTAAQPARESSAKLAWRAHVDAGAGVAFGVVPAPAPRFELSGGVEHGAFGALLGLQYSTPEEKRVGDGHGVRAWALGGRVAATFAPVSLLRFGAGVEIDRLRGSGLGAQIPDSDSVWMIAPLLEAALVPLQEGRLRLELALSAHYALVRPSFEILNYGAVFQVARVGGSAVARVGWRFR
jgi:hypothetical protein